MVENGARNTCTPNRITKIPILHIKILAKKHQNNATAMSILFGHPTGNPNSHNAALAYLEAGVLDFLCVPWMPSTATIRVLSLLQPLRPLAQRLARRQFGPLSQVPKVQGRVGEICRLLTRASGLGHYLPFDQANRWLMRTMAHECRRSTVTAVHSYEDCSLWQFI